MTKKVFCVFILIFALMCIFTSCNNNTNTSTHTSADTSDTVSNDSETSTHTHSFGEWKTVKAATCTTEGNEERDCSCGEKQVRSIPTTEHYFGDWKVVKEATCTEQGREARSCLCGKEETKSINVLSHVEIESNGKMPTAINDGYAYGTECKNCNTKIKDPTTLQSLKNYVYANPTTVSDGDYYFMTNASDLISSTNGVFQIRYSPSKSEIAVSLTQFPNSSQTYITSLTFNDVNATYMTYIYGFYFQVGTTQYYDIMKGQFKVEDLYNLSEFSYTETSTTIGGTSRFDGYKSSACATTKDIVSLLDIFLKQYNLGYTTEVYGFTPAA